jgi:hypothetical protein
MWRLAFGLAMILAAPEGPVAQRPPVVQRPGDPVIWAFEWDAPPECPSRADVIARVQVFLPELEAPPPAPGRADLRVVVRITNDATGWTAAVSMSGREGASERRFSAPACVELAEAVALISAVALDPVLVARSVAAVSESLAPEPLADEPPVEPPSRAPQPLAPEPGLGLDLTLSEPDDPASPRSVRLGVGLFGTGAWGPAATGFGGVAASFAVFRDRWRWQLEGGYAIPRTLSLADGRRGRVEAWWLGTRGCVVPRIDSRIGGALELPSCPGVEAGQVFARGLPPTTNTHSESQPWAAIVIGQGLRWPFIERLALTVEAAVIVSLVRGAFVIGDRQLTSLTPVGFRGGLGLEARF